MPMFDCVDDQTDHPALISRLAQGGLGTFSARAHLLFGPDGTCEGIEDIIEKMRVIAKAAPEARLVLSVNPRPSAAWQQAHRSELCVSSRGLYPVLGEQGRFVGHLPWEEIESQGHVGAVEPSVFSARESEDGGRAIQALLLKILAEPFGDRIAGVFLHKYVYGEWAVPHWTPDVCEPAKARFRKFLNERYPSDEALQRAWLSEETRRDVPMFDEEQNLYQRLNLGMGKLDTQALRDYLEVEAQALAEKYLAYCRAVKHVDSRLIAGGFFGYGHPYHSEIRSVIDDPAIDFICTPMEYLNRQPGGGVSSQSPFSDMPPVHGTVFFDELDSSTHLAPTSMNNVGRPQNLEETHGVLWRDWGQMLIQGKAGWILDFAGGPGHSCKWIPDHPPREHLSYHDDPEVLKIHRRFSELWSEVERFDTRSVAEVKIFFPDQNNRISCLGDYKRLEMPMCGFAYEEHSLGDFMAGKVTQARLNVLFFPVMLNDEERSFLSKLLQSSKEHWLICGPIGLIHAEREALPNAKAWRELSGFEGRLDWLPKPTALSAQVLEGLGEAQGLNLNGEVGQCIRDVKSRNMPYIPGDRELRKDPLKLEPVQQMYRLRFDLNEGDEVIARYSDDASPAVVSRLNASGGRVTMYPLPVVNSELLRLLARMAGAHLYTSEDHFVVARRGLVLLHQSRDGEVKLTLPHKPSQVVDLIRGQTWSAAEMASKVEGHQVKCQGKTGSTHFLEWS